MAKAPKKPKERKLTKAQIGFLDKAEVRKICLLGMGLDTKRAYELSPAEMVTWMVENQSAFLDVDLPACDTTRKLRPGVIEYMVGVQQYLRHELEECPTWNHDATPESPHNVSAEPSEPTTSDEPNPLTTVMDEDDEDEPAELVEFPETETPAAPAVQETKMDKPAFKTGMQTPLPFFRKTTAPAPATTLTPDPEPDPAPLAAPVQQNSQIGGIDPTEFQALIEMVSDVSGTVRDLPAAFADLKDYATLQAEDLRSRMDVRGLHKKVDALGVEVRELAASVQHLSNGVALLVNIWRPMGVPYASLADVPEPAAYLDDVAAE